LISLRAVRAGIREVSRPFDALPCIALGLIVTNLKRLLNRPASDNARIGWKQIVLLFLVGIVGEVIHLSVSYFATANWLA